MDVNKAQNTILGQDTKCLGNEQKHYSRISNIEKFLRGCYLVNSSLMFKGMAYENNCNMYEQY